MLTNKNEWGAGAWQDEPDHEDFRHAGLPCILHRSMTSGGWCGYVAVPKGHPLHGVDYQDCDGRVDVHGGLTYGRACQEGGSICHVPLPGESADVWWLGFDCGHGGDLSPAMTARMPELQMYLDATYRTIEYAREQTKALAEQLKTLGGPSGLAAIKAG
jgi:hypothetical protein